MRLFLSLLIFSTGFLLNNCGKAPVFPETPEIEYREMVRNGDTLTVTIAFKDGNGDLGLSDNEMSYPYQEYDYVKTGTGTFMEISEDPSNPPYNCYDYFIGEYNADTPAKDDTILINRNENHFNYFIEYLIKQPDDTFLAFDFENLLCSPSSYRFPYLSRDEGPIEGDLSYKINMGDIKIDPTIYSTYFLNKYIKFRIHIQDRALNKSNVVETEEILVDF